MSIKRTRLNLHKDIASSDTDETQSFIPGVGEFSLVMGAIYGGYDLNCKVEVTFDGGIMFHGKGGETLLAPVTRTGDGVKVCKMILDCTDLPSGSATLGGDMHFEEES